MAMTDAEKLTNLKLLLNITGDTEDPLLTLFLSIAKQKVLKKLYPFAKSKTSFDDEGDETSLSNIQIRAASFLYFKQGAEGEMGHTEGEVERDYGSEDIPSVIFEDITPYLGVREYELIEEK